MTASMRLRAAISDRGLKLKFVAAALNLTPYGLQKKIDNKTQFKASEIVKLADLLHLSSSEVNAIFFAKEDDF